MITKSHLIHTVAQINSRFRQNLEIDWSYGRPRPQIKDGLWLAGRMSTGDLHIWLMGYWAALEQLNQQKPKS